MGIINSTKNLSSQENTQPEDKNIMQSPQAAPQPVSFELPLDKDLTANPPVKQRLEQREQNPITLEQIQEKLEQAEKRKAQVIASQISQVKEVSVKGEQTQERKSSMERAQGEKAVLNLGKKLETAETRRTVQLSTRQERAKTHNNKVQLVRERKSSQEKAMAEKAQNQFEQKHTSAEQRTVSKLNTIQEKAKTHNHKVQQVVQSKAEEAKEELDTKKAKVEGKMSRAASQKDSNLEKAKAYNEKHQQKMEGIQTEQKKEIDEKKTKMEDKLTKAAERRDGVIEQVKQTAAQSAVLKMSPKKTQQQEQ